MSRHAAPRRVGLVTVAAAVLSATVCAGTAMAYYQAATATSASGAAGVANTTVHPVKVEAVTATDVAELSLLVPGGKAAVVLRVQNDNSFPMTFTLSSTGTVTGCTTPDLTVTLPSTRHTVPAGSSKITLPGAAEMGKGSSNDCQGKTMNIGISLTGQRT